MKEIVEFDIIKNRKYAKTLVISFFVLILLTMVTGILDRLDFINIPDFPDKKSNNIFGIISGILILGGIVLLTIYKL
jgi:hypothetical protein